MRAVPLLLLHSKESSKRNLFCWFYLLANSRNVSDFIYHISLNITFLKFNLQIELIIRIKAHNFANLMTMRVTDDDLNVVTDLIQTTCRLLAFFHILL